MIEKREFILKQGNRWFKHDVVLERKEGRIWFLQSPYQAKDEIKAMMGSKWHGFDDNPLKVWSVKDCPRNNFNIDYLSGKNVYEWFDRPLVEHQFREYTHKGRPASPMDHQFMLANGGLTWHYQIWSAEMGTGKSLAAQMVIEHSNKPKWTWVGPKNTLENVQIEFEDWGYNGPPIEFLGFEQLVSRINADNFEIPAGMIVDESSKCGTATSQRTRAVQQVADEIRRLHGYEGFVIEMTGTPATKSPVKYWPQCEIAWPGFMREGSPKALEKRLAFMVQEDYQAGVFNKRVGWKDDENKCNECGDYHEEGEEYDHEHVPSVNEISKMYGRLKGLVTVVFKKDCIQLPPKRFRRIHCEPTASTLRAAKVLANSAPNTITGLTWLRELSDGFLYKNVTDGTMKCKFCKGGKITEWRHPDGLTYGNVEMLDADFVEQLEQREVECPHCHGTTQVPRVERQVNEVPCPKLDALKGLLGECEETGRIGIFAGFTGSVDRVSSFCMQNGWDVLRCDGRGMTVLLKDGGIITEKPLRYWKNWDNPRVAFVAHPESGGYGLTLTESRMGVFYSNVHKSEVRVQAMDRFHRKGMDENLGCEIVDLLHLPSDERILELVTEDRRVELLTLGELCPEVSE